MTAATTASLTPVAAGRRRSLVPRAVWHVVCLAILALMLYPIAWQLGMSFKTTDEILHGTALLPKTLNLENYLDTSHGIGGVPVWRFFVNSFAISSLAVIGNVTTCALAAYAFARLRFRMRGPLFAFMLATIMLPYHVVLIPQYIIFNKLHMVGSFLPLVLPKFLATDAFFIFLIVQFMRGLPAELGDAARVDGAGPIRAFTSIILPLSRPALITTAIFTFIWTWNDFLSQLIYLNNPKSYTAQIALSLYVDQTDTSSYGAMFAMSVLTLIPIGAFFFAFQRYLVEGVSTSGMGGA
jgi:multiple sugar transport system permease protein